MPVTAAKIKSEFVIVEARVHLTRNELLSLACHAIKLGYERIAYDDIWNEEELQRAAAYTIQKLATDAGRSRIVVL